MPSQDDLWYAAKSTRVVYEPPRLLETFGETSVRYYMVTELLDEIAQIRIRTGRVTAERPRVIMPRYFVNEALENFGADARKYVEDYLHSHEGLRIIRYGLRFRKEDYGEEVVNGNVDEVADQVSRDAQDNDTDLCGVVIGADDLWEVSLFRFISELVRKSLPHNAREMAGKGLLNASSGVPNAVRIEIESEFRAAEGSAEGVRRLGRKLRDYGLFEEYEDRFFELFRRSRG